MQIWSFKETMPSVALGANFIELLIADKIAYQKYLLSKIL